MCCNPEYRVVVLPEPVGPVTKIIPSGYFKDRLYVDSIGSGNPKSSISIFEDCLSRSLSTTLSPYDEGSVETLTSTFLEPSDNDTRPS